MEWILEYKWYLLLVAEITSWLFTFAMFYSRYWLKSTILFWISTIIAFISGWVVDSYLMVLDFLETGTINLFIFVVVSFLVYGLTIGKNML